MTTRILTTLALAFFVTSLQAQQGKFSGTWTRNTEKCDAGELSINSIATEIGVKQDDSQIEITRTSKNGQGVVSTYTEKLKLDRSLSSSVVKPNVNKRSSMTWSSGHKELSETANYTDDKGNAIQSIRETWTLLDGGKTLSIKVVLEANGQVYNLTEIYDGK